MCSPIICDLDYEISEQNKDELINNLLPDQKTETIAEAFANNIIARHGVTQYFLMDRDGKFVSTLENYIDQLLSVQKTEITVFHPAAIVLVESPFFLLHGRDALMPKQEIMTIKIFYHAEGYDYKTEITRDK